MDLFQTAILSLIEGATEFIPVSSTGHLVIASKLLKIPQNEFLKSFEVVIQSGAILAVLFLYWKDLFQNKKILKNIIYAFIPTALIGFVLYKFIKSYLIGNAELTVSMLILGGIVMIIIEKIYSNRSHSLSAENLSTKQSLAIGVFQSISIVPGVSRAAATILSGMGVGLKREEATKFSFLLAIPTMFAATGFDLFKNYSSFNSDQTLSLATGLIGSFIASLIAIKWFIGFVKSNNLIIFGIYRIIAGIVFFFLLQY